MDERKINLPPQNPEEQGLLRESTGQLRNPELVERLLTEIPMEQIDAEHLDDFCAKLDEQITDGQFAQKSSEEIFTSILMDLQGDADNTKIDSIENPESKRVGTLQIETSQVVEPGDIGNTQTRTQQSQGATAYRPGSKDAYRFEAAVRDLHNSELRSAEAGNLDEKSIPKKLGYKKEIKPYGEEVEKRLKESGYDQSTVLDQVPINDEEIEKLNEIFNSLSQEAQAVYGNPEDPLFNEKVLDYYHKQIVDGKTPEQAKYHVVQQAELSLADVEHSDSEAEVTPGEQAVAVQAEQIARRVSAEPSVSGEVDESVYWIKNRHKAGGAALEGYINSLQSSHGLTAKQEGVGSPQQPQQGPLLEYVDWAPVIDAIKDGDTIQLDGTDYKITRKDKDTFSVEGPDGIIDPISKASLAYEMSQNGATWHENISEEYLRVRKFASHVVDNFDVGNRDNTLLVRKGLQALELMHTDEEGARDKEGKFLKTWSIKMPDGIEKEFTREELRAELIAGNFMTQEQVEMSHVLDALDSKKFEEANKKAFEKAKDITDQTYMDYVAAQLAVVERFNHIPDSDLSSEQITKRHALRQEGRKLGLLLNHDNARHQPQEQWMFEVSDMSKGEKVAITESTGLVQKGVSHLKKAEEEYKTDPDKKDQIPEIRKNRRALERHGSDLARLNNSVSGYDYHAKKFDETGNLLKKWLVHAPLQGWHQIGALQANALMKIDQDDQDKPIRRGVKRFMVGNARTLTVVGGLGAAGAFPLIAGTVMLGGLIGLGVFLKKSYDRGNKISWLK